MGKSTIVNSGRACAAMKVIVALFASGAISGAVAAQQLVPFKIASQTPPIFEYIYVNYAIEGGFLKKEGIDAKFVGFTSGLTTTQALAGGSVDAACDGFTGTVGAIAKGSPAKVVYAVNSDNTYVVVSRDTIAKASDSTVDWIPIGGTSARARAVVANQVDATLITAGEWLRIRDQAGVRLLATLSDTVPPLPLNLCAVSAKLIAEHPDVVQKVVTGILNAVRAARTPEGRKDYIRIARQLDPSSYTDKQYDELYEYYFGAKGNPLAVDPNGGLYPEVYVNNMKSMVADKSLDAVLPLEKLWDPRFVNQYLGDNGWYDVSTRKDNLTLRDLVKH
jgi:ABC-type nitrate/sulfonate/bicarbonate transport system substrate-binding protein